MQFELPKLPYAKNALAPLISAETLEFHYGHHHLSYVENLNRQVVGTRFAKASLKDVVLQADGELLNNAAQAWNHAFYWKCLAPLNTTKITSTSFVKQVNEDFMSLDSLMRSIRECALSTFGSGWTWLVRNEYGRLRVISTPNAQNPLRDGNIPILVCDVWEHAYYIDYRNERAKYLDAYLKLINLTYASQCFEDQESECLMEPRSVLSVVSRR